MPARGEGGAWHMTRAISAQGSALLLIGLACFAGTMPPAAALASDGRASAVRSAREESAGGPGDSVECSEGAAGMSCGECERVDVIAGVRECKSTRQGNITRAQLSSRGSRMPSFANCRTPVRTTSYQDADQDEDPDQHTHTHTYTHTLERQRTRLPLPRLRGLACLVAGGGAGTACVGAGGYCCTLASSMPAGSWTEGLARPRLLRMQPRAMLCKGVGGEDTDMSGVMRVRGGGWLFDKQDERESDRRAADGRPRDLKRDKEDDERARASPAEGGKGEGKRKRPPPGEGHSDESEEGREKEKKEEKERERQKEAERERLRERERERERGREREREKERQKDTEKNSNTERERESGRDARERGERGGEDKPALPDRERDRERQDTNQPSPNRPWWRRLGGGGAAAVPVGGVTAKTDSKDVSGSAPVPPAPGLPPGFVALDPALLHKIRELQRSREREMKATAPKGPASWFRRLMRFGIALATLQPVAVTLVLNIIKLFLLFRRVVGGALDLDVEDGYKPTEVHSNTTFADVVGVDEAKKELQDIVAYLKDPAKFTRLGGKMAKGVLLWGPPGTGKTLLARAIAGEAGVPFRYASGSEFEEMYVGVGARRVRDLFQQAKKQLPCIVFLDEIDAIGSSRSMTDQQSLRQTLNQILTELDGFSSSEGLIVIAATNFPEVLDKALTRPGRFDRHVEVPNPDVKGREAILRVHSRNVTIGKDVDLHVIARGTPGFSGAELASLVNKAACSASSQNKVCVAMKDLEAAKDLILMGGERSSAAFSEENRRLTAVHEGGHALVACLTDGALPVHKATIVPRGQALGMVMQLPDEDMSSWSQRQMLAEMDVCMGGRAAEELVFGIQNITSGASSDLERATSIATSMVEKYGMSRSIGLVSVSHGKSSARGSRGSAGGGGMSDSTKAKIDIEVRRLTEDSYNRAYNMLKRNRHSLNVLAEALLNEETLTGLQVREILGESSQENSFLSRIGAVLGVNAYRRDSKNVKIANATINQVKDIGDRLSSVENVVEEMSTAVDKILAILQKL